jgi:hypothetical protein
LFVDGLRIVNVDPTDVSAHELALYGSYEVLSLQHVDMQPAGAVARSYVEVHCADAVINAAAWSGLNFGQPVQAGAFSVDASACGTLGAHVIGLYGATGPGAGQPLELDPFDVVDWFP